LGSKKPNAKNFQLKQLNRQGSTQSVHRNGRATTELKKKPSNVKLNDIITINNIGTGSQAGFGRRLGRGESEDFKLGDGLSDKGSRPRQDKFNNLKVITLSRGNSSMGLALSPPRQRDSSSSILSLKKGKKHSSPN